MLGWLFGAEREARRLNRDAVAVIEHARGGSPVSRLREAAIEVERCLAESRERSGGDPALYDPIIDHFRMQHREARRRADDASLTAMTMVLIYLRAEMLDAPAEPARSAIEAAVAEWKHASEPAT